MGKCLELRDRIFGYLRELDAVTENYVSYPEPYLSGCNPVGKDEVYMKPECQLLCNDIQEFLEKELCISLPESTDCKSRVMMIRRKLDRPIRSTWLTKRPAKHFLKPPISILWISYAVCMTIKGIASIFSSM